MSFLTAKITPVLHAYVSSINYHYLFNTKISQIYGEHEKIR